MKRMVAAVVIAAAVLSVASASATQWYLLDASTGECEVSKYAPQSYTDMIRRGGHVTWSDIKRDDKGNIVVVMVAETKTLAAVLPPESLLREGPTSLYR
jgi:hypothetical protein